MEIDPRSTVWTFEETEAAAKILDKIAFCHGQGKGIPLRVFEAHLRSKKNISSEVVITNAQGEVYLIQRPSLTQSPFEPYPELWRTPGVTHLESEVISDTIKRLEALEFGGVKLQNVTYVDQAKAKDPPRGRYLLLVFYATLTWSQRIPGAAFLSQRKSLGTSLCLRTGTLSCPWPVS